MSDLPWDAWLYGALFFISVHFGPPLAFVAHYSPSGPLKVKRLKAMAILCFGLMVVGAAGVYGLSYVHLALSFGLLLAVLAAPYAVVWQYRKMARAR